MLFLKVNKKHKIQYQYEAYNKIFTKEGNEINKQINFKAIAELLMPYVVSKGKKFDINLNPEIIKRIVAECSTTLNKGFSLPRKWQTTKFTFETFGFVFKSVQAILIGRMAIRDYLANNGLEGLGYSSIIWMVKKVELVQLLTKSSEASIVEISSVIDFLTFGNNNIRNPDIATQPIINLGNDLLGLSPFVWTNLDGERNLCVLLNKVKHETDLYLKLVKEKESILRQEIIEFISENELNYEVKYGDLGSTDLDMAIIDRENKVCICIELKWFIEPAEIDEMVNRSKELSKGVHQQAKEIIRLFKVKDDRLLNIVLKIDKDFDFCVIIGSRNWIGNFDVQDDDVPIIKVFHLLEKMKELSNLKALKVWLDERKYLPIEGVDYSVVHTDIEIANWKSKSYGIVH